MLVHSYGKTDIGRKREKNEDSYLIDNDRFLFVVADGMGGHLGGEFASRLAVNTINEIVKSVEDDPDATLPDDTFLKPGDYSGCLRFAISVASRRIYEKANEQSSLHGMGTTSVAVLFRKNKAYIANVGDSRVYQIRKNKITQITKDHSLVGEQVRAGILSVEDSREHRFKNIITRSVGYQEYVDSDVDIRILREGDSFLLCSDGLSNMLGDEEILEVVTKEEIEDSVTHLIAMANERGGEDNITAVLVKVLELDKIENDKSDDPTIEAKD